MKPDNAKGFIPLFREGAQIHGFWLSADASELIPDVVEATPELAAHLDLLERVLVNGEVSPQKR